MRASQSACIVVTNLSPQGLVTVEMWLRGLTLDYVGNSVGQQHEPGNAADFNGDARCSTTLDGVTIHATGMTNGAPPTARAAAARTHASGNARTRATCSCTT